MHGDNEFCRVQLSALFRICKIPYAAQDLIGQSCTLEYLLRRLTWTKRILAHPRTTQSMNPDSMFSRTRNDPILGL